MFREKLLRALSAPENREGMYSWQNYFCRLPVLETPRLLLRPLRRGDAEDLFAWSADPEVARYVLWEPHRSIADTRAYLRYIRSQYRAGLPSSWGITLKDTGRVIGTIGFMWASEGNRSAEVGYSLARDCWNRGLGTEALRAVILSGFSALNLNRIEAQRDARNPASGRVMEKCGMRQEGILRSRIRNKGEFIDVVLYAILREDLNKSGFCV